MWNTATNRPATNAPNPAIAYWARESWPVYPVSTTIDSRTIATPSDTVSASIHFGSLVSIRKTMHAAAEQRPVPRHPTVADHRHLLEVVVAEWQRPAAEHEHDDDDEEGQRWCKALLIGKPTDQCLADAEREPRCRGDRK